MILSPYIDGSSSASAPKSFARFHTTSPPNHQLVYTTAAFKATRTSTASTMASSSTGEVPPANIQVKSLSYEFPNGQPGLKEVCMSLPQGSRTLLIGGEFP